MYQAVSSILGLTWAPSASEQECIVFTCCALVIILTVVFTDMIYRVFSHFWRG